MTPLPSINESKWQLFLRFLRFGCMAFGGPFAQIAMIRHELVDEEKWVSKARFNRALAIYQALPGPEAHELCVYFGTVAHGRVGGVLAGLGFMLPGLGMTLALAWAYVTFGLTSPLVLAAFIGCQAAVAALIFRAAHRIGQHALSSKWLWACAIVAGITSLLNVSFTIALVGAAAVAAVANRVSARLAVIALVLWIALSAIFINPQSSILNPQPPIPNPQFSIANPPLGTLFVAGLRGGLLTFGGAYTAIPFVQSDAVETGKWMSNAQFLDGIAITSVLPTPLVMFVAFVGYLGAGLPGGLAMVLGMFLPAFAFTLIGHDLMERLIAKQALHAALDGIAAAVVGIVAATALQLLPGIVTSLPRILIFAVALFLAFRLKSKWATAAIMLLAAAAGILLGVLGFTA